jgi:ribosomal protein S18 acetylase RimI-like enzyme
VRQHNTRTIARYEKSGYRLFGRHRDYDADHGDALRFVKLLDAAQPAAEPAKDRLHPRAT